MRGRGGFNGAGAPPADLLLCFPSRSRLALTHRPVCSPARPNARRRRAEAHVGSEPTSPKVNCAGQVRARGKVTRARKGGWIESLGLKKDVAGFLAVIRSSLRFNFKLNMQCFGSADCYSDEDDGGGGSPERNMLSEWFMVLDEKAAEAPPRDALLLMRCRSAPARREKGEEVTVRSYAPDFFELSTEIAKETWVVSSVDPLLARSRSCKI